MNIKSEDQKKASGNFKLLFSKLISTAQTQLKLNGPIVKIRYSFFDDDGTISA
jgi:hypothetical protein